MRAVPLNRRLPIAFTLSLTLLIVGTIGLGAAIRRGEVMPPALDLELGIARIVAYTTHYPWCPPKSVAPQAFYVVWSIYEPATAEQPYGRTARHMLVMALNPG